MSDNNINTSIISEKSKSLYETWVREVTDPEISAGLAEMKNDPAAVEDAFYRDLAFGTGGLRGVLGAGTNRMNIYTVAKASQGLADYVIKNFESEKRSIAISYDSRINSDVFSRTAASIFAANGIKVWIYSELMPTPCLSYAVRYLGCSAGVMVTASHNPSKYNGYKVYGSDGCQITTEAAAEILAEIEKLDLFSDVKSVPFEEAVSDGIIQYVPEEVYDSFTAEILKQSQLTAGEKIDRSLSIVYTPLNGTGLKPVTRALSEAGYSNITIVKEQEKPDGNFPTCPYPNPEIREAMELGIKYAEENNADLLLATDPDCDREGIAVRDRNGAYVLLSGNETGMLLLDYICSQRIKNGTMPADPVFIKTIVTTDMAERIASHYGLRTVNVLTGFKFIGEQIGLLEKKGKEDSFVFGFEESYGCLSGTYVRDKDAVDGAFLICEMFSYYRTKGISLLERLEELYRIYGYTLNTQHSYEFDGEAGFEKMQGIMDTLRAAGKKAEAGAGLICGKKVIQLKDYAPGIDGLPKSNVLKFYFDGDASVVVRPSGTEPKLKVYISVSAPTRKKAAEEEKKFAEKVEEEFITA